jgi:Ribbon-helix-helix protein
MENRTARLTLLIDPNKKAAFEKLCVAEDVTPSQKVRQFIREYLEQKIGPDWAEQVLNADNEDKPDSELKSSKA